MKQCDIWYADLNPVRGSEQQGFRPVVIISGNMLNQYLPVVIVCPLTSKIKNYKGNIVLEPDEENGLTEPSEIMIFHIRSISKERLVRKIGEITSGELDGLKLGLDDILR
ncbi:MAG TPA: type II toxin-antitoxin system PemK/MazF family toxin, partial [Draconibacterium sp.]|nr:type II toxin-antitoxin system PemK/MazF family toxin [Draconibacterium sp.]